MLPSLLCLVFAAPAPEPPPDPPKGPAPILMVLDADKDGRGSLLAWVKLAVPVTEEYTALVGGVQVAKTRTVMTCHMEQRRVFLDDDGVTVYGVDGKKLDAKTLPKRSGPVPVLVSVDGKEVDPFYLLAARPGTLIIVAPALASARPEDAPAPPKLPETPH